MRKKYPNVLIPAFRLKSIFNGLHYSQKTRFSEESCFKYSNLQSYVELLSETKSKTIIETGHNIGISHCRLFDEVNPDYLLRKYGKPNYIIDQNKKSLGLEIYLYKQVIEGHKAKFEVHFFENKMFFYSYTFPYTNHYDRTEIAQLFKNKYHISSKSDLNNNIILDQNKSIISFSENLDFTVNFIHSTADFFKNLDDLLEIINESDNYKKRNLEKELYDWL